MKTKVKLISGLMFFMMCIMCIAGISAFAQTDGEWTYEMFTYNGVDGVAVTSYNGSDIDVYVPAEIEETNTDGKTMTYPVLKIGDGIFQNNTAINSVTLSSNIKVIGDSAFSGASNMVCIVTNEGLEKIGANAFAGCSKFNSVILNDSVTQIDEKAFSACDSLTIYCNENSAAHKYAVDNNIKFSILNPDAEPETYEVDGITYYIQNGEAVLMSYNGEAEHIDVPSIVEGYPLTRINASAFFCKSVITISLPETITEIGAHAFAGSRLQEISIPNSVRDIGELAFQDCRQMTKAVLSESMENIPNDLFQCCFALKTVVIPRGISRINNSAFYACYSLEDIIIPDTVEYIGEYAFDQCNSITDINIPDSVTAIGDNAFSRCPSLRNVHLSDGITKLGDNVFSNCISLENINLPSELETLGSSFNGCFSLNILTIPKGVTTISEYAFENLSLVLYVYENSIAQRIAEETNIAYIVINSEDDAEIYRSDDIFYFIKNGKASLISCNYKKSGTVNVPETIKGYTVNNIAQNAFSNCENIYDVYIPDTVETIGERAFYECKNLHYIKLPQKLKTLNDYMFVNCFFLETVIFPAELEHIRNGIFMCCGNLNNVELPNSVTDIGDSAFWACTSLSNIVFPDNLKSIGYQAFSESKIESLILPNTMEDIGQLAFDWNEMLKNVEWPAGVSVIKEKTFYRCTQLTTVTIPEGVTTIEMGAFSECRSLKTINLPESIEHIDSNAFKENIVLRVHQNSYSLDFAIKNNIPYYIIETGEGTEFYETDKLDFIITNGKAKVYKYIYEGTDKGEINIPEEVEGYPVIAIGEKAFENATGISKITMPDSITEIGTEAFANSDISQIHLSANLKVIENGAFKNCFELESIELPENLIRIGSEAFRYCNGLKEEVIVPDSVTMLERWAFANCVSLKKVHIPNEITYIDDYLFEYCEALEKVEIPSKVKSIGLGAFQQCHNLRDVSIPDSVKYIDLYAFMGCNSLKCIILPQNLESLGMGAFWGAAIESINIPSKITSIESSTFQQCFSLGKVFIPDTITSIANDALAECPNLILCVYENSYTHTYAIENNILYFILPQTDNPYASNGQSVMGTVTSVNGSAKADVAVELIDKYGNIRETVRTDANGEYTFTYAEVGSYIIRASDAQGNTGSDSFSIRRKNVFEVYLLGNTDITIQDNVSISGTVTDENGNVLSGAEISLIDETGMILNAVATDENGQYCFSSVPNGTYNIRGTTANGGASIEEVTVFAPNGNVEHDFVIRQGASVDGNVVDENGDAVVWAEITVTNSNGDKVSSLYTDKDGHYTIESLPVGDYSITAVFEDVDKKLTGVVAVKVKTIEKVTAETIVVKPEFESAGTALISGKVTAHGQGQVSSVVLKDVFMNEIAVCATPENGKYKFLNVADGAYIIVATTESDGAGFTSITVKDGKIVSGSTSITVYKTGTVEDLETQIDLLPEIDADAQTITAAQEKIIKAKNAYDSLSDKDKKRVSAEKFDKLNSLTEIAASSNIDINSQGVEEFDFKATGMETVISDEEIKNEKDADIALDISADESISLMGADETADGQEFGVQQIKDRAEKENKTIVKYFDIGFTKTVDSGEKTIKNVKKDSVGTGKIRITFTIPEEYRGHKNYSMLHMHNGQLLTLADTDDNPDTVTFETDKFSKFALTYDDNVKTASSNIEPSVTYDNDAKTASIVSDMTINANVIFAAYSEGRLVSIKVINKDLSEGNNTCIAEGFDTSSADSVKVMVWQNLENITPLSDSYSADI